MLLKAKALLQNKIMKKRITSYLDQLKFDAQLSKMKISSYLTNVRLVMLFIIGIVIFGLFSFFTLPRRLNPEVKIPIVSIVTTYPGAGPAEVENSITEPLEAKLMNAKNLNTLSSSSRENVSIITAEFSSSMSVDDARDEVQKLVSQVNDLPENSFDPVVRELDFEDVPVWQFVITTDKSRATLEQAAKIIETELENQSMIDRVVISGIEEKEIQVVLDQNKIVEYGLSPIQLMNIITANAQSLPAGRVETDTNTYSLSLGTGIEDIESVRNLPINLRGVQIRLGDIADVSYKSANNQARSYISTQEFENQNAVTISVYKTKSADISKAQNQAEETTTLTVEEFNGTISLIDLENIAEDIDEQFSELYSNFASTIFLVFATLFIFLGLRQAAIASASIPLTFLISFGVMSVTGQTLNFLTLFSLLLALGLLVDDAIVIISAATTYYKTNRFSPREVGLLVWRDYLVPIWTTTITTVWAFVPLLLSSGIIGEFIKPIPVVVSTTLLASTTVAVLITLPLMMILLRLKVPQRVITFFKVILGIVGVIVLLNLTKGQPLAPVIYFLLIILTGLLLTWKKKITKRINSKLSSKKVVENTTKFRKVANSGFINIEPVSKKYKKVIAKILNSKKYKRQVIAAVIIVSVFSYALLPLGFIQNEFFPKTDSELVFITLELPNGSNLEQNESKSLEVARELHAIPEVTITNLQVGQTNRSQSGSSQSGDNLSALSLRLLPSEERKRSSDKISDEVRSIIKKHNLKANVFSESGGPPAGSDVTVKIIGEELSELQKIADEIIKKLETISGVFNIEKSVKQGNSKIVFNPNLEQLTKYGVTTQELGLWMRTAVSGFELYEADFSQFNEKTKIKLYLYDDQLTPEEITSIPVLTANGPVPITELGTLTLEPAPSVITREDGKRTLTVTASVKPGFNAGIINSEILSFADTLSLPRGYSFATGGANEENIKSVQSIMQAMLLSIVLILATMVIQLGSFRQAVIVILVIPLAISGVFILFALTGTPLSFPALIGVLALFGIVVNNSIMVVDKINQNIEIGMEQKDAISDATASRVEPIFFSSLTTIIGLIPITLSDPIWQGLGGAIIAGLLFSGMIMLLVIPVSYDYFYPTNK
jgi:HAE1 family hydrophobic/amphiphilic exporter-1